MLFESQSTHTKALEDLRHVSEAVLIRAVGDDLAGADAAQHQIRDHRSWSWSVSAVRSVVRSVSRVFVRM